MSDSAASEFVAPASLARRLPRALRRRLASYWARFTRRQRPTAEAAFDSLRRTLAPATAETRQPPSVATLGRAIAVAARFSEFEVAANWSRRLLSLQLADGSFPDGSAHPSRFHTSQALRGLLSLDAAPSERAAWEPDASKLAGPNGRAHSTEAIAKTAAYLAGQLDDTGLPRVADAQPGSIDRWGPRSLALSWLPPLVEAARLLGEPQWEAAARRSLRRQLNSLNVTRWDAPTHWWAYAVEALTDLGECAAARTALRRAAALQTPRGDVPALPGAGWVSAAGLALLASAWHRLGSPDDCRRGDLALAALARRQRPSGGFSAGWGRQARQGLRAECPLTAALFLSALHGQTRRAFVADSGFPVEIDAGDGRLAAVLQWCRDLGPAPRIIDVGCGKGRFLRHLRRAAPQATLVGVDLSPAALAALPEGVEGRQGDLLRLPAGTGEFDAALCVEAVEHALLPRRAVAELCRVVRPGGSILIIDKNALHQPLSDHQPWERWFRPDEVAAWLAVEADDIRVRPVAHGGRASSGLFLCWTARRRGGPCVRRAA